MVTHENFKKLSMRSGDGIGGGLTRVNDSSHVSYFQNDNSTAWLVSMYIARPTTVQAMTQPPIGRIRVFCQQFSFVSKASMDATYA